MSKVLAEMTILRAGLAGLLALLACASAEASVRLVEDRPDGLVAAWTVPAGGRETLLLAAPAGRLPSIEAAGAVVRSEVLATGWRGLVPTVTVRLSTDARPAGELDLVVAWAPGALAASVAFAPGLVPSGAWEARETPSAELLNPATAQRVADAVRAERSLRPPAPPRPAPGAGFPTSRATTGGLVEDVRRGGGAPRPLSLGTSRVKIVVAPDAPGQPGGAGLYRITPAMLGALGADVSDVRLADLRLVTIDTSVTFVGQAVVPLRRHDADGDGWFGAGDWIEFWGEPMLGEALADEYQDGDFTDERGYVLDENAAAPSPDMAEDRDGTPVSAPAPDYLATARAEVNDFFINATRTGEYNVDHFYWCSPDRLFWTSSTGTEAVRTEALALPGLASGSATRGTLRVRLLHRYPDAPATPDHRSIVDLNSRRGVSDVTGDGYQRVDHVATGLVAGTDLLATNTITLRAPGVPGSSVNLFELDWIEADYPRTFDMDRGRLVFAHDPGWSVVVRGVSAGEITVLDVTDPLDPHVVANVARGAGTAAFELSSGTGSVRHAVQETPPGEPALIPASLSLIQDAGLRDASNAANVVVIGPRAWLSPEIPALQRWRARRQAEGLTVREAAIEDVMDEFGSGSFTPAAVAGLLTEAFARWAVPPDSVLLLGDTTYDYKNLTDGRVLDPATCADVADPCGFDETAWVQLVPTRLIDRPNDTQFLGWYASDVLLACVAGNDFDPDAIIGRIPARTATEAGELLDKVLRYEDSDPPWGDRVLLVADQIIEPLEQNFETYQNVARDAHLLPRWNVTEMYYQRDYGGDPPEPFTQDLLDLWRDPARSAAVVSYVGHGSAFRWSSDDLLLNRGQAPCRDDVAQLAQPGVPEPLLINANCITGTFVYPLGPSLLEELVRAPEGGAIAGYGPTGVTELSEAQDVLNAAYGRMHGRDGRGRRVGDAILHVQHSLAIAVDPLPVLSNAFLGDPTLQLAIPFGPPAISLAATPGDALVDLAWPAVAGAASYAIWRSDDGISGTYRLIADGVAGTSLRDTGDPPGPAPAVVNNQLYHYALEPLDAAGHPGRWSARVPVRPCTMAAPAAAGAITVTPGPCSGSFSLRWGASPTTGLQGYHLRIFEGPVAAGVPVRDVIAPGVFAPASGLRNWQEYTFTVNPITWCNVEGPTSGPVTSRVTCPLELDPPSFIPDLRVTRDGADVRLQWSPVTTTVTGGPATVAAYRVHRASVPDFMASAATTISEAAPASFTDAGRIGAGPALEMYAVAAIDASGRSGGVGHDLPQGVHDLAARDLGTEWELTWSEVTSDIRGQRTPVARYLVYASDTAITRSRIETEALAPATVVTAPPARLPDGAGTGFFFVVPEDVHGNRSAD